MANLVEMSENFTELTAGRGSLLYKEIHVT